ncbi:putative protein dpy-30 [Monocercomonoides exilis]|uniref:putative protein dpy-30 n=1 Tax=Monocercomonoides exilis TaxID=2049356 RepID=UPI00355A9195|nr:putative protein dpy-30 [Monocercomonoides exilis]|eukprot:MONOS_5425.1-p1 / transcript=MONOS_5425.1 / gene=MONOS_5425 / organism=Monocercomonoides_exilis_PA203 / gene_product=unspecified product / transcript_product=unspecified product / location=Mono_scaffold00157:85518-85949(+) / protein_length=84 / sequence_SO=supercontig / SO=protein_coding / is_pseudo=false
MDLPPAYKDKEEGKAAEEAALSFQNNMDVQALPIRAYLDQTVVPLLLQGITALVAERPANPVEYLAAYLLKHNPQRSDQPQPPT